MDEDVASAVSYVEEQGRRLLSGRVSIWELIMTGGLWRVSGQQVERAAAAANAELDGEEGLPSPPPAASSGGRKGGGSASVGGSNVPEEEVRGPHAALAVRLRQRDPDRTFVLGERLQYVLLAGPKLQDEAAEDPLVAARQGLAPNYELYWRNKCVAPLTEVFTTCLTPAQLQALLSGPHTLVRVDVLPDGAAAPRGAGNGGGGYGLLWHASAAPTSPSSSPSSPPLARSAGLGGHAVPFSRAGKGGGKQAGLTQFFKQRPRCLSCRQPLSSSGGGSSQGLAPGLCDQCQAEPGRWGAAYAAACEEDNQQQDHLARAVSACIDCHSGGLLGEVACENAECPALYDRLGAARRVLATGAKLSRLRLCDPHDW